MIAIAASEVMDAATFTALGFPRSSDGGTKAVGVSDDGTIVAGSVSVIATNSSNPFVQWTDQAVRWTLGAETSAIGLGALPGTIGSKTFAMSADGKVLVGVSEGRAFRWSAEGGMVDLGVMPTKDYHVAWGVSGDGSVVVGSGDIGGNEMFTEPFVWTSNKGLRGLGFLPGGSRGEATAISRDGRVIVGYSISAESWDTQAFRRGADGVMRALDVLGEYGSSIPWGVSSDGSVVVGTVWGGSQAFRWSEAGGIEVLGVLEGFAWSEASAVSADGNMVVGASGIVENNAYQSRAFIWDSVNGMRDLQVVLKSQFQLELSGWTLEEATGISADGTVIVGEGINPQGISQAWLVKLPKPQPTLSIKRTGTELEIRWSASFSNAVLQSTTTLMPNGVWQRVTNAPSLINGVFLVSDSLKDTGKYFRLQSE